MKLTKDIFPQFVEDDGQSSVTTESNELIDRSLSKFGRGNNVPFARCWGVKSCRQEGARVFFTCGSVCYLNRLVMTHETTMYQWKAQPDLDGEIEVCLEFWSDSVFRVRFGVGGVELTEPSFPPKGKGMLIGEPEKNVGVSLCEDEDSVTLKTAAICVRVSKDRFCLRVTDAAGKLICEQSRWDLPPTDSLDMSVAKSGEDYAVCDCFRMNGKEEIYGLGERFDHVARRGVATDFWNKDAFGTSNTRTYINVPFVMSTAGYGVFLNSAARTEWKIGTDEASSLAFITKKPQMDYFILAGGSLTAVLRQYCTLTGFAPVPPIWSFGLWMSRNSYLNWDIVHEVADGLRERKIPADVLHLDTAWFKQDWNCNLRFSEERFAEPQKHMAALKAQGFRTSLWQYNFIPPREDNENYVEAREKGYLALDQNGSVYKHDNDLPGSWKDDAVIDFSNPEAADWYGKQIEKVIREGGAAIKTDFGEGIPENAVFKNVSGKEFHNLYTLLYNGTIFEATRRASGESIVWARSGTAGSQRYPLHWGGDSQCTFSGLAGTVRAGLSAGLSGFTFFSHDIGGFIGRPTPELYIRWAQVGLFGSHSRCHGGGNKNSREPWAFGEQAERVFTKYVRLRYRLLPYIITEAHYCAENALPMMKAMILEDGTDLNMRFIDDQYLFGRNLLVAPVLEAMADAQTRQVYLPRGVWYDFESKQKYTSAGQWFTIPVTLEVLPVFVREGAVIPYGRNGKQWTEDSIYPIERLEIYGAGDTDYTITDGVTRQTVTVRNGKAAYSGSEQPEIVFIV